MANFFDGNPQTDFQGLMAYVKTHSPNQMLADIRASSVDPNDLPGIGDMVKMFLKDEGMAHAKVLFAEGIRQLEAEPSRKAADVNLMFARRNLCLCCMPNNPLEAFASIQAEPEIIAADPALAVWVAAGLVDAGSLREAAAILGGLDQLPMQDLASKLEESKLSLDIVNALKARVRAGSGRRKMSELQWLSGSGVGDLPGGLLEMDLEELSKHGIPPQVLSTIKTAVVFQMSNDRKMWFCGFFDVQDPRPLLAKGITGRFRADFYNRIGKFGEDGPVNVYGVHRN